VTKATVDDSTLDDTAVEQCLLKEVRSWIFPKPKGGGTVEVFWPYLFKQGS